MTTATRPTARRVPPPVLPQGDLPLLPPPALSPSESLLQGLAVTALPMVGSLGSIAFVATSGHGSGQSYVAAGLFLLASGGFVVVNLWRSRSGSRTGRRSSRRAYLRHLGRVRAQVRSAAHGQRQHLLWVHPAPAALALVADDGDRVWERTVGDPDWLRVRFGVGSRPASLVLRVPEPDDGDPPADPVCADALARLVAVHRDLSYLPQVMALDTVALVDVHGPPDHARSLARAVLAQVATFHPPDQLVVAVLTTASGLEGWDWVKWLPHAASTREYDAAGGRRLVVTDIDELMPLLPVDVADRPPFDVSPGSRPPAATQVLLVVDHATTPPDHPLLPHGGIAGVTVLRLGPHDAPAASTDDRTAGRRRPAHLRLVLDDAPAGVTTAGVVAVGVVATVEGVGVTGHADQLSRTMAEATARRLAGAWSGWSRAAHPSAGRQLTDLLGIGDVTTIDRSLPWAPRAPRDLLRVPIGIAPSGETVHLDLKESSQHGSGPHGLLIGATGSGKSELLRTIVLGLALTHPPEVLNLVLVDFKGGATFSGLSRLPHVSALITNLAEELSLVDRMQDALSGELTRRQELLRAAGGFGSRHDYERARASGEAPGALPLPSLLVVCDEFSELLSARPELVDLFVAIGRLGRSLGVHLLLASQRLEEGRLRGLDSHLSYRLALRTFSASESRAVIGVPDAYALPALPGLGLLRDDPTSLTTFTAAYVSGPAPGARPVAPDTEPGGPTILPFVTGDVRPPRGHRPPGGEVTSPSTPAAAGTPAPTVLDVAIAALAGHGGHAHPIWLPPLDLPDPLDRFLPDLVADAELGLVSPRRRADGPLRIPLGVLDRPREQRREVLWADLSGADGHLAVVGAPRSGRSTLLRTVVLGLAVTLTPRELQLYVLDFGGGTFEGLRDLPHVAGIGSRSDPEVVSRIVAEVTGVMDDREAHFRAHDVDGIETYRTRRRHHDPDDPDDPDDGWGDVVLVVDGWGVLRSDFPDLEPPLHSLAQRGLTYGVHLVTSATRWMDFRAGLRDVIGTRVELRLGDPMDSEVDRRLAAAVPTGRPGRGLATSGHHFLAALPRLDGIADPATLAAGVDDAVTRVRAGWVGRPAPRLRLLPRVVDLEATRGRVIPGDAAHQLVLGLGERHLTPTTLAIGREPHLLVLGEARSGKSTTLRTYLREVRRLHTPDTAQVFLVDYRRTHLGELPDEWLADCATTADEARELARGLAVFLQGRLPGPGVTPSQLRTRSWWEGREAFVVIDDYELVASPQSSPLEPLIPLLARASDVGLHVVLARRSGGFGRAYDGLTAQLRDLAQPGLLLSGDPAEGAILGNLRPVPAPPGRGRLLTRDGVEVIQVAWTEPAPG